MDFFLPRKSRLRKAYITQLGSYLPKKILTNQDLASIVDTSDEWISSRTGIKERRIARPDEFTSDMGEAAANRVLERADCSPLDIDLVLVATLTPDYPFPSTASLIQARVGAKNAAAFDISAACSGWIYGLSVAKAYIESGMYQRILFISSEKLSSIINYEDRSTCVLFGDGAAACLIEGEVESGIHIGKIVLGADGQQSGLLTVPAGGCKHPTTMETVTHKMHYLQMDGKEIFKHAVRRMEQSVKNCLEASGENIADISYFIPHQANERIIDAVAKRCGVDEERVVKTIRFQGNTSAASVGLALNELCSSGKIVNGDQILLTAFGAGLTWGSAILRVEGDWKS